MQLDELTREHFEPYLHSSFKVWLTPTAAVEATLIQIEAIPLPPFRSPWAAAEDAPRRTPFSLLFRLPLTANLPQRMYRFEHAELGDLPDLFIAPIGMDGNGRYYEAVFN